MTVISLSACSSPAARATIPVYCDYVRLPTLTPPISEQLTFSVNVGADGIIIGMHVEEVQLLADKVKEAKRRSELYRLEIDWYRSKLEYHNRNCTNPIDRASIDRRI